MFAVIAREGTTESRKEFAKWPDAWAFYVSCRDRIVHHRPCVIHGYLVEFKGGSLVVIGL